MTIDGRFSERREMLLDIQISSGAASAPLMRLSAVVDTGFEGFLALPPEIIRALELPYKGNRDIVLADGTQRTIPIYDGAVLWNDQIIDGTVFEMPGEPLAGMGLLWDAALRGSVAWRLRGYAPTQRY